MGRFSNLERGGPSRLHLLDNKPVSNDIREQKKDSSLKVRRNFIIKNAYKKGI